MLTSACPAARMSRRCFLERCWIYTSVDGVPVCPSQSSPVINTLHSRGSFVTISEEIVTCYYSLKAIL